MFINILRWTFILQRPIQLLLGTWMICSRKWENVVLNFPKKEDAGRCRKYKVCGVGNISNKFNWISKLLYLGPKFKLYISFWFPFKFRGESLAILNFPRSHLLRMWMSFLTENPSPLQTPIWKLTLVTKASSRWTASDVMKYYMCTPVQGITTTEDNVKTDAKIEFIQYGTRSRGDKSGAYLFLPGIIHQRINNQH